VDGTDWKSRIESIKLHGFAGSCKGAAKQSKNERSKRVEDALIHDDNGTRESMKADVNGGKQWQC